MADEPLSRDELVGIITANNMVRELVEWLRAKKGLDMDPVSLRDIEYGLLLEFAVEKGLVEFGEAEDEAEGPLHGVDDAPLEERALKRRSTKPKKHRRKT